MYGDDVPRGSDKHIDEALDQLEKELDKEQKRDFLRAGLALGSWSGQLSSARRKRAGVKVIGVHPRAPRAKYPRVVAKVGKAPPQYGGW